MVSVCMATYNGANYLKGQVDSILSQLGEQDELVVSDDGSTDATIGILCAYQDSRIKIFRNENSHGVICNFNHALMHARGDIIFLADQDDVWLDGKIKSCKTVLEQNVLLVMHDAQVVDKDLNIIYPSFFKVHKSRKGFWNNLYRNSYLGCCLGFRRELLDFALPLPEKIKSHDMWLGLAAELKGKTVFIPEPYHQYRRHGANVSSASEKSQFTYKQMLEYRWNILRLLVYRYMSRIFKS